MIALLVILAVLGGCAGGGGEPSKSRTLRGDRTGNLSVEHNGVVQDLQTGRTSFRSGRWIIDSQTGKQTFMYGGFIEERPRSKGSE